MRRFFDEIKHLKNYLELDESEILSTIVMSVVNLNTQNSYSIIIGDGSVYIDGIMYSVKTEKNEPKYIGYFLNEEFEHFWGDHVFKYSI